LEVLGPHKKYNVVKTFEEIECLRSEDFFEDPSTKHSQENEYRQSLKGTNTDTQR